MEYVEMDRSKLQGLKIESTWKLLGLGVITYGVYYAYYLKTQSKKINKLDFKQNRISEDFILLFWNLSWASLFFFVFSTLISFDSNQKNWYQLIYGFSNITNHVWYITLLVWGFLARNRVNSALGISRKNSEWFSGIWTFLFTPMYFNYKINKLCDAFEAQIEGLESS